MTKLFRSMKEDSGGHPAIGPNARSLGVRPGIDVLGLIPTDIIQPGEGGLSGCPGRSFEAAKAPSPGRTTGDRQGSGLEYRGRGARPGFMLPSRSRRSNSWIHRTGSPSDSGSVPRCLGAAEKSLEKTHLIGLIML